MEEPLDRKRSIYMHWAKSNCDASVNLGTSGLMHYPLSDLGISLKDLEISGPTYYGYEPLQKSLAAKCGVDPDCIAAATGTSMANHLVMAGLLNPGDEVIIELPTYEPLLAVANYLGAKVKRFRRNFSSGFQIDLDEIKKLITTKTRLIVISNLHNPSGVLTNNETLIRLGKLASPVGARVMVDEVYLECLYPASGSKLSSFHLSNTFVVTSSLTKAYGLSGLRCGWILAEPELIQRFWKLNDLFAATPAHTAELLSVFALKKLPEIGNRANDLLKQNRILLKKFFEDHNDQLEVVFPEFGTIAFPRLKSGDSEQFVQLLRQKYDTSVVPGRFFEMPEHFRVGIGIPTEMLKQGLANISQVFLNR